MVWGPALGGCTWECLGARVHRHPLSPGSAAAPRCVLGMSALRGTQGLWWGVKPSTERGAHEEVTWPLHVGQSPSPLSPWLHAL